MGCFCILVFLFAATRVDSNPSGSPARASDIPQLRTFNDQGLIKIKGTLYRESDSGKYGSQLYLSASAVLIEDQWLDVSGNAVLLVPRYPEHHYGEKVMVSGKLETPSMSGDFDYPALLARQDIFSTTYYPQIVTTGQGGSPFLKFIYSTRSAVSRSLERVLPEPHAALARGIVLGIRTDIPASLKDDFTRTGTTHLLAISGVNLTIIAGLLLSFTFWIFGRRHYIYVWTTAAVILIYAWLTGLQPPVVRAAIMVGLFLGADLFGRQRRGVVSLFLAAVLMTVIDSRVLFEASFQMSIAAMAGLFLVSPPLQQGSADLIDRLVPAGKIKSIISAIADSFAVSLGAIVVTWPLVAYYFGIFSWIGPLATLLLLPVMPAVIVTSVVSGGLGLIFTFAAQVMGWSAWLPLSYMSSVVSWLARIPGISIDALNISYAALIGYYGTLVMALLTFKYHRRVGKILISIPGHLSRLPVKWSVYPLAVVCLLAWSFALTMPDQKVHVSFLDVGQGDAILIETGVQQILIDGGPDPGSTVLALSRKMPFWDRTIDMVILTHPDSDHLGGLINILDRYRVTYALSVNCTYDSALYSQWLDSINHHSIEPLSASAGQTITIGSDISLTVLNPGRDVPPERYENVNSLSVVIRLEVGDFSFLLTGDLDTDAERDLIRERANLKSTILKIGHHGSASSTSREFLDVVSPAIAVISVGQNNTFGHPDTHLVQRLEQDLGGDNVYRTDRDGTIEFITDGHRLWVTTDK